MREIACLSEISQITGQTQTGEPGKKCQISILSIFQIMKANFLFFVGLFRMAPSLMYRMDTS